MRSLTPCPPHRDQAPAIECPDRMAVRRHALRGYPPVVARDRECPMSRGRVRRRSRTLAGASGQRVRHVDIALQPHQFVEPLEVDRDQTVRRSAIYAKMLEREQDGGGRCEQGIDRVNDQRESHRLELAGRVIRCLAARRHIRQQRYAFESIANSHKFLIAQRRLDK